MRRTIQLSLVIVGAVFLVSGCQPSASGPNTVAVSGTLTIDGEPADGLTITLSPLDADGSAASGPVTGGSFELFSGVQGKAGAVPGKYKVTLAEAAGSGDTTPDYMKPGAAAGSSSEPKEAEAAFPAKYGAAETSDKEVEVTAGGDDLVIEIVSK